ncbi:MAG: HipA domain-containing protein [Pseudomonadota bacterium]
MTQLQVFLDGQLAGILTHSPRENLFSFSYDFSWLAGREPYALCPDLPIRENPDLPPAIHSAIVQNFFGNLLPEGQALTEAAAANKIGKGNIVGLMIALGRETAGALSLHLVRADVEEQLPTAPAIADDTSRRPLTFAELSERIRDRPNIPFSVWDGKVRLSIAGYQDKVAVFEQEGNWYMIDSGAIASTVILKPEPVSAHLAGLTSNEFFCMKLAKYVGLPTAHVRLVRVPEPVLAVDRFDRVVYEDRVQRLNVIDGCQALGLSASQKYERNVGDGEHVKHIREGASLPLLFGLLNQTTYPAAQRLQLLRWQIFQILIGNTDAHAKNISFFNDADGLRLAPTYDLVSTLAFDENAVETSFAMAIGDAFKAAELTPYEWANFAYQCQVNPRQVSSEITRMCARLSAAVALWELEEDMKGLDREVAARVVKVIERMTAHHTHIAKEIVTVDRSMFE